MAEPNRELLDQPCKPSILETLLVCKEKETISKGDLSKPLATTSLPKSQVLGKVKDFLGEMAKANKKLELEAQEKPREEFDLEALTGNEKEYIEMDLLLGVADLNSAEAVTAAEASMINILPDETNSVATDSSSSEDSDQEEDENDMVESENHVKKQEQEKDELTRENKRQKKIVVLN